MAKKYLPLKRIRYWTMNSWNQSSAPAYNMKVYNLTDDSKIIDKLLELLNYDNCYDTINDLVYAFNCENKHEWQAGFNGRSGGYLVLYRGGVHENGQVFSTPGKHIDDKDVPTDVLKRFRQLALDIQREAIYLAENATVKEVEVTNTKKVLVY